MPTPTPKNKISVRGVLPEEVKRWILENTSELTPEQMAEKLNVNVSRILPVLDNYNGVLLDKNFMWRERLKKSKAWRHIKNEFNADELEYFSDKYIQLMEQFKEDILPTEEQQAISLIRLEIMQHRNMSGRKQLGESNARIQGMIDDLLREVNGDMSRLDETDRDRIIDLQNQQATLENAQNLKTKEFLELGKEHNSLTEKLKASRVQRINAATNDKLTWPELVKMLMERENQEKESRKYELHRIAGEKEFNRLSKPHKYMDNNVDIPILSYETMDNLNNVDELTGDESNES